MRKKVVARAPGKLILSGEYSALYKMPAIAFAVDNFTETTTCIIPEDSVVIELKDYNSTTKISRNDMELKYLSVKDRYKSFLSGTSSIDKVIESPIDLCCFIIRQAVREVKLQDGIRVSIKSTVPIGAGFGSSAALIVSLIKSLSVLLSMRLTNEEFYELALEAENLVHGPSSGIDLLTSIIGGCNYFFEGRSPINSPDFEFFSVFTGKPEISTGKSIAKVKSLLKQSDRLHAFKEVTLKLKDALENKNLKNVIAQIRNNHSLLKELGVVPKKVQEFIEEIELCNGAAKVCGSGAVAGKNAGAVVSLGNFDCISKIAQRFGYTIKRIKQSSLGAYVV